MRRPVHTAWILLGLLILLAAPAPTPALADGDPLEMYDFSGERPTASFVQQSRTRVYQYGLWTIQRHVDLDPFAERRTWHLKGCTNERINIYYGTRPMWCSERTRRVYLPRTERKGANAYWEEGEDTLESDFDVGPRRVPVVFAPGGRGILVRLGFWNGGASAGSSSQIIRLTGTTPASAKVESIWTGAYEMVKDLDGDGTPEIIDSDFAHSYASYLPHKGIWATVVLAWDAKVDGYVVANDRLYFRYRATLKRSKGEEAPRADTWAAECRSWVVESLRELAKDPGEDHRRELVVLSLAHALTSLLWTGHVDEARALLAEVDLAHFGSVGHERLTKEAWWRAYLAGCRRSRYWEQLCGLFPKLSKLR